MHLRYRNLFATLLLLLPWTSLLGQRQVNARFMLTSTEVAHAIVRSFNAEYTDTSQPTVLLLADVTATEADPQLDVDRTSLLKVSGTLQKEQQVAVRIRCHTAGVCLPFYAFVSWPPLQTLNAVRLKNTAASVAHSKASQTLVHTGAHVTLVLQGAGTRLELPVITLQSGVLGAAIRAVGADRRHIYTAKVYSADLLKGSL
jgi:hypothetical protein